MDKYTKFFLAITLFSMIFLLLLVFGCSTTNSVSIIQRADNLSSAPDWASITTSIKNEGDRTFFIGYAELPADASKSGALNMTDQKAYASPMESMVDLYFQQNEVAEDIRSDSSISQLILSAVRSSRPPMPGLRVIKRYWEVAEVKSSLGTMQQLHVFSLAEIPTSEYEKVKRVILAKLNGNSELKRVLKEVSQKQRDQIFNTPKSDQE